MSSEASNEAAAQTFTLKVNIQRINYSFTTSQRTQSLYIRKTNPFILFRETNRGRDSSVSLVTRLQDGRYGFRIPEGQVIWVFTFGIQIGSGGPTQPWIQWTSGFIPGGQSCQDVILTTHLHVVPRLRMSGGIPLLPYTFSWCGQGKLNFLRKIIAICVEIRMKNMKTDCGQYNERICH
jgi:hypothetical protein